MKKFAVITGLRMFADVIDGPGWTDIEVNSYYDTSGKSVSPQYHSSPTPGKGVYTVTSR